MNRIEQVLQGFHKQGYKVTPQRREILKILIDNKDHPTAEDVYQQLTERMPDVSLATVYNTLNMLKNIGMVNELSVLGEDSVRYDPKTQPHDHVCCLQCQRVVDIEDERQGNGFKEHEISGFWVFKRQVAYYGYCPQCRQLFKHD